MRQALLFVWEIVKVALIALAIVVPIRTFLFQPFIVRGASMEPNFHSGDYLIVDELSYHFRDPERGEVVVFRFPEQPSQRYIKRVIGLPGEQITVKENKIRITSPDLEEPLVLDESGYRKKKENGRVEPSTKLGPDEYFVLGDNRSFSSDSRNWGSLEEKYIVGRVLFRLWPIEGAAHISSPAYQ